MLRAKVTNLIIDVHDFQRRHRRAEEAGGGGGETGGPVGHDDAVRGRGLVRFIFHDRRDRPGRRFGPNR